MPVCARCKKERLCAEMGASYRDALGNKFWKIVNKGICTDCEERLYERSIRRREKRGRVEDGSISNRLTVGFWMLSEAGDFGDGKPEDMFHEMSRRRSWYGGVDRHFARRISAKRIGGARDEYEDDE